MKNKSISKITDRIYIGSSNDAQDKQMLSDKKITAILNVSLKSDNPVDGIEYVHLPLYDSHGNSLRLILSVLEALRYLLEKHQKVLVHCRYGIKRSPAIVALYLYEYGNCFDYYEEALVHVRRQSNSVDIKITEFL